MKTFLKILNYFFTTLGVIFFIILSFILYFFVADPFNLKPLFSSSGISPSTAIEVIGNIGGNQNETVINGNTDKNGLLSPEQTKTLESIGINPATLPTEVTPELEKCLIEKVGAQRAEEISNGSEPTAMDFLKASACLK